MVSDQSAPSVSARSSRSNRPVTRPTVRPLPWDTAEWTLRPTVIPAGFTAEPFLTDRFEDYGNDSLATGPR